MISLHALQWHAWLQWPFFLKYSEIYFFFMRKLYSMGQKWFKVCNNERVLSKTFLQTEQIEKVKAAWKALQQICSNFLMQLFYFFKRMPGSNQASNVKSIDFWVGVVHKLYVHNLRWVGGPENIGFKNDWF